jgi:hypothetical protein
MLKKAEIAKRSIGLMMAGVMLSLNTLPAAMAETMNSAACPPAGGGGVSTTTPPMTPVGGHSYVIPAGTALRIQTTSVPATAGQPFNAQLISPVVVDGSTVVPAGSSVSGTVVGVNPVNNTMNVQFREVSRPSGQSVPVQANATVSRLQGTVVQTSQPAQPHQLTGALSYYPRVSFGPAPISPTGALIASTAGGAVFGGAVGTLTGLTMAAATDDIGINEGTGALRGLGWGAAYGAGIGLLGGLLGATALASRNRQATNVSYMAPQTSPMTNISTGSLNEIPVSYPTGGYAPVGGSNEFIMILDQPVQVTM